MVAIRTGLEFISKSDPINHLTPVTPQFGEHSYQLTEHRNNLRACRRRDIANLCYDTAYICLCLIMYWVMVVHEYRIAWFIIPIAYLVIACINFVYHLKTFIQASIQLKLCYFQIIMANQIILTGSRSSQPFADVLTYHSLHHNRKKPTP